MANVAKEYDNSIVVKYLSAIKDISHACDVYCFFDEILTGTTNLDAGGNTRPLRKIVLFDLLKSLPIVSVKAIQHRTGYSKSHSTRLTVFVRVLSKAFQMHVRDYKSIPGIPLLDDCADDLFYASEDRKMYYEFLLSRYK